MAATRAPARSVRVLIAAVTILLVAGGAGAWWATSAESAVRLRSLTANDTLAVPDDTPTRSAVPSRLVVLGDSVATGAGCGCTPLGPLLARDAARIAKHPVEARSFAQDGLTSSGLLDEVRSDAPTMAALRSATAVTITIGANDFDSSRAESGCDGAGVSCFEADLQTLPQRLSSLLSTVRALAGPRAQLLVTGYWNVFLDGQIGAGHGPTYQRTSDLLTRRVNTVLAQAAGAAGGAYIDLYTAFRGDGDRDDTKLLAADGDHPSALGSRLIAQLLARRLSL